MPLDIFCYPLTLTHRRLSPRGRRAGLCSVLLQWTRGADWPTLSDLQSEIIVLHRGGGNSQERGV